LHGPKHQDPETNAETRLLEANKKRLLTQPDWVGIHASKPVSLQFLSREQKEKIGKRRATRATHGAIKKQKVDRRSWRKDPDHQRATFVKSFHDGVRRNSGESIRIRIGVDALTDTYSTQPQEYAQSHASSESMLFDQGRSPIHERFGRTGSRPSRTSGRQTIMSAYEQNGAHRPMSMTSEGAQCNDHASGSAEARNACGKLLKLQPQPTTVTLDERASSTPGFRPIHGAHGNEGTLHLVFSGSNSPASIRTHKAASGREVDETKQHRKASSPCASQAKRVHHHVATDSKNPAAYAIVDQEPWTMYLAISDDCSVPYDRAIHTRDMVHSNFDTAPSNEAATKWSQHVSQGQDDDRHGAASSISGSLPSVRRAVWKRIPGRAVEDAIRQSNPTLTNWRNSEDDDERNWQAFVLGNDSNPCLQAGRSSPLMSKSPERTSSKHVPLCVAVSSMSPLTAPRRL